MSNDNIIQFPLDKVVRVNKTNKTKAEKQFAERVKQKQTKEFCDTAVDDISMNLLRHFVDLALKTTNYTFTKDLALLIHGKEMKRSDYMNTQEFLDTIKKNLELKLKS